MTDTTNAATPGPRTRALTGVSVFEQELYEHVTAHADDERATLNAYATLADGTESETFAFLAAMILDDERRHHQILADLADTIRLSAQFSKDPIPVPHLDLHKDREAILAATEQLLEVEKQDQHELRALAKKLKHFKGNPLWALIVRTMQADNDKHRMILEFVRAEAKRDL